jgi:hypothetical protein
MEQLNTKQAAAVVVALREYAEYKQAYSNADDYFVIRHGERMADALAPLGLALDDVDKHIRMTIEAALARRAGMIGDK